MARSREEIISEMVDSGLFSDDEIRQAAQQATSQNTSQNGLFGTNVPKPTGVWDALSAPEKLSREGLTKIAEAVPAYEPQGKPGLASKTLKALLPISGVLPQGQVQDVLMNVPKVGAEATAEIAPGFISRASLLTAGASKAAQGLAPLARPVLRAIGKQGEELSGIAPKAEGALEAAYKDPTLIFAKGKKAAGAAYEAGKAELEQGANVFKGMYKPEEILDTAKEYIGKGGTLEPAEALMARKAIDSLLKSGRYVKDELLALRNTVDGMAKASSNISAGDVTYQRGMKAEALRNFFPQNKYGGSSGFKTALATAMGQMGPVGKAVMAPLFSPITQGTLATGAGMLARGATPANALALSAALQFRKRKSNAR